MGHEGDGHDQHDIDPIIHKPPEGIGRDIQEPFLSQRLATGPMSKSPGAIADPGHADRHRKGRQLGHNGIDTSTCQSQHNSGIHEEPHCTDDRKRQKLSVCG